MIKVKVTWRDDTSKMYNCNDFPVINDMWTTVYLNNKKSERIVMRSEFISQVRYWYENEERQ